MARRRNRAEANGGQTAARHPLLRLLLADAVVQNGSRLLRRKASQRLLADPVAEPDQPMGLPKRLATLAAMRVATRSWPGAAIVGAGMLAHGLYKRGKARRADQAK
jgi:hypothetical protein